MDQEKRHGHGIHYTNELDIHKIVGPSIVRPFQEKINKARTKRDKRKLLREIQEFKVLDPACGSGNFLYIAFRELRKLEMQILEDLGEREQIRPSELGLLVSPKNFYGIDTNKFGLELAKVALSVGRKLLADEFNIQDPSLPFDDLDDNFLSEDALFTEWPETDAIIGNPPFFTGREFLNAQGEERLPKRFMIDFNQMDILSAKKYKELFQHIQKTVLPDVKQKAENEIQKHGKPKDWNTHLNHWWRHWRSRPDLIKSINKVKKYIVVSRTVKEPIVFEFISSTIRIVDAVVAFDFEDNYS